MTEHAQPSADKPFTVFTLSGDIDLEHAAALRIQLLDAVQYADALLVDMSAVTYIDSSGVANLVEALQAANDSGHRLALVALSEQAQRVFELARLDKVFTIFRDLDAAAAGCA